MPIINNIQRGFRILELEIEAVKEGFNDWVLYLQRENNDLKQRVELLEKKLRDLGIQKMKEETY